ncbi:2-hydroxyisoflavanone dehydratase-like protein, partial [Tanacetum coccineum]
MDPTENEVIHDFAPFFHVYKNGQIKKLTGTPITPPSTDPTTNIVSKDVIISHDPKVSARLYLPVSAAKKLPLIIYIHGGAFTIESAFSTLYHTHLNSLTSAAEAISISIEYRLAPEHLVPACYDDCWEALKWVEQQSDIWIKDHADLNRVFLVGDSAGANIAHNLAVRAGVDRVNLNIVGMILVHPFFVSNEPGKLWMYICPGSSGVTDPRINPAAEPGLTEKIVCGKVLVCVAGDDTLKDRGVMYYELLKNSGWNGEVEIVESKGEDHVFHLFKPDCEEANKFVT